MLRSFVSANRLLLLFVLGSASGVLLAAVSWWGIDQSARELERLHRVNLAHLEQASVVTVRLARIHLLATDIQAGTIDHADARSRIAGEARQIVTALRHLREHFRHGDNAVRLQTLAAYYASLMTSHEQVLTHMQTDPAQAAALFRVETQVRHKQALEVAASMASGIMTSVGSGDQDEARQLDRRAWGVLVAALVFGIFVALAAILGRRLSVAHARDEEALRLAAGVFDNANEGVVITSRDGRIVRVNPAFTALTGYTPEDVIGHNPRMFSSGRQSPGFYRQLWATVLKDGRWQGEIWNRRKNGEIYPEWLSICSIRGESGEIAHFVASFSDLTERKRAEDKAAHYALHDALTDLPNRALFLDRLEGAIAFVRNLTDKKAALLFIDLDRFKLVNDSLGHVAGDRLLQLVAQRLIEVAPPGSAIARLGGDEFAILLPVIDRVEEVTLAARKVLAMLRPLFTLSNRDIFVSASIGISLYPDDGTNAVVLMKHAGAAMSRAKKQGRNSFQFYTQALAEPSLRRLELENALHRVVEEQQLRLHYQPQIDLANGRVRGVEALVRWQHPELGLISPAEFIPLAEENGTIVQIGAWVLRTACEQARVWREAGFPDLVMAVNLSVRQFFREDIAAEITRTISDCGLEPRFVELEITESVAMGDVVHTIATLESLASAGMQLAVDDFGTGYSSLSQLKKMPVGILKIDRSFVQDITTNKDDAEIVNAVITMAHRLGLKVVAEGVESVAQLMHLREQQCDFVQGYLCCRPLPATELGRRLIEADFSFKEGQPACVAA